MTTPNPDLSGEYVTIPATDAGVDDMPDGFWTAVGWFGGAFIGLSGAAVALHARAVRRIEERAVNRHMSDSHGDRFVDHESRLRMLEANLSTALARVESLCGTFAHMERDMSKLSDQIEKLYDRIDERLRSGAMERRKPS